MTDEQRYEVINAMPTTLQLALMDEGGILDDKHKTIGHKHKLKKIPVSKDSKKWQCSSKVSNKKCKNEMPEEEQATVIGWTSKEDENYSICVKCAIVESLLKLLQIMLNRKG